MQQKIFDMLLEKEEVSWKTILQDLVKTEQMDPWNINISLLTQKYIQVIKSMQEHNLRISGKILLAAAFLLRIKSTYLIDNDISKLDALIHQTEEEVDEEFTDAFGLQNGVRREKTNFPLIPKTPQERNRKVSISDLVGALQRAMASKKRALARIKPKTFKMPTRKVDIMEVIRDIYHKIVYYTNKEKVKKLSFTRLLPPRAGREEKVYTFLPLLHLENQQKVSMEQSQPFEEIFVSLMTGKRK